MPPKKSNVLLYVLVGCGGLFVLGLIVTGIAGFVLYKSGKEFAKNQPRIEKTRTTTTTSKPSPTDSEPGSGGSRTGGKSLSGAPSWVAIYPGATVENQFSTTSGDSKSGGCTLKTDESVSSVLDFYEEHMKSEGLKVTKTTSGSAQTIVGFSKDYVSQMLTVSASDLNGRQIITLVYSYKE
jgi:hypothetical protein